MTRHPFLVLSSTLLLLLLLSLLFTASPTHAQDGTLPRCAEPCFDKFLNVTFGVLPDFSELGGTDCDDLSTAPCICTNHELMMPYIAGCVQEACRVFVGDYDYTFDAVIELCDEIG